MKSYPTYKLVRAGSEAELEEMVNDLAGDDWRPQGGVAVTCADDGWPQWYFRAMAREPRETR